MGWVQPYIKSLLTPPGYWEELPYCAVSFGTSRLLEAIASIRCLDLINFWT